MEAPDADPRIQAPIDLVSEPTPTAGALDLFQVEGGLEERKSGPPPWLEGGLFGAFVGLLMGPLVGGTCASLGWHDGLGDFLWGGVALGAALGPLGGALLGAWKRKGRSVLLRVDVATFICVVYGLLPALFILLMGFGLVHGKFSGLLLLGTASIGPMGGLLLGAILDRAYEEAGNKSWARGLVWAAAGVIAAAAACAGGLLLLENLTSGPSPDHLAMRARSVILGQWHKDPQLRRATLQNVTLTQDSRDQYSGFADAVLDGEVTRIRLKIVVEGDNFSLEWKPIEK